MEDTLTEYEEEFMSNPTAYDTVPKNHSYECGQYSENYGYISGMVQVRIQWNINKCICHA